MHWNLVGTESTVWKQDVVQRARVSILSVSENTRRPVQRQMLTNASKKVVGWSHQHYRALFRLDLFKLNENLTT